MSQNTKPEIRPKASGRLRATIYLESGTLLEALALVPAGR